MKMKRFLLPLMVMVMMLVSTVAYAASGTLSVQTTKSSGKVLTNESISYVATTTSSDVGIAEVNAVMRDKSNGEILNQFTGVAKGSYVNKYTLTPCMPNKAAANLEVTITVKDRANVTKSFVYNYTMDAENKFTITPYEPAGFVNVGQDIKFNAQTSQPGVGMSRVDYTFRDNAGTLIKSDFFTPNDHGWVGSVSDFDFTLIAPSARYSTFTIDIKLTDVKGTTFNKTFSYRMSTNTLTLSADYATGTTLPVNSKVKFTSTSSNLAAGTKTLEFAITKDGVKAEPIVARSSHEEGSNPLSHSLAFTTQGNYTVVVKATDILGTVKEQTFNYKVGGSEILPPPVVSNGITITFDPTTRSHVEEGDYITINAKAAMSGDPVNRLKYTMYDEDGDEITSKEVSRSYYDVKVPENLDTDYITIKAQAYTAAGITATETGKFYLTDDEEDGEIYKGVINPDLDDLAIDLWTVDNERMYELDSTIEFVAYYYNFEKSSAKNVVIEVEIPDGFTVRSKTTSYGSVRVKNDTIIYSIGTVPSKTLREVRFSLRADDDDLSETDQTIVATIYEDTDDEMDTSTQRIFIYESGEKGSRKAFITGYTDGTFRPDNNITREEVAAMMARAFNYSANYVTNSFSDVKSTSWSYKYVAGCHQNGIIKGYTDGSFRPNNNISISELYTMTYRAMGISDDEKSLFVPKAYKKSTSWETNYVAGLVRLGMLKDKKMDDLEVTDLATRAQVVYLISRVQFRNTSNFKVGYYQDVNSSYWNAKDIEAASYNYSYKRASNGKETINTTGTYLTTNSNYIK